MRYADYTKCKQVENVRTRHKLDANNRDGNPWFTRIIYQSFFSHSAVQLRLVVSSDNIVNRIDTVVCLMQMQSTSGYTFIHVWLFALA